MHIQSTKNRKMISRIVWLRDYVLSYMEEHGVYTDVHEQPQITTIINNNYVTDDNYKTWFTPNEKMIHILEKHEREQLLCELGDDFYENRCK